MSERASFNLSGAAGLLLAALTYFLASRLGGLLTPFEGLRGAEALIFAVLFGASLVELPLMVLALRALLRRGTPRPFVLAVNAGYVAFGSVYAFFQILLYGPSNWALVLAALSIARWMSDGIITRDADKTVGSNPRWAADRELSKR